MGANLGLGLEDRRAEDLTRTVVSEIVLGDLCVKIEPILYSASYSFAPSRRVGICALLEGAKGEGRMQNGE